jgi:photosynthetic reaction center cytochrome c subunit
MMKHLSTRPILSAATLIVVSLTGAVLGGQARPQSSVPMAEDVFKNVRVLRGIPVDEFMGTMGVFSASLGISCADCHTDSDTNWENYALDTSPKKVTARRMVQMMTSINQASFGGRQVVTCYTCHRGSDRPKVTPSLAALYGEPPPEEPDDVVKQAQEAPRADQVLDKYIQAIGGAQRVASLTSFVAKGTSVGYGPEGTMRPVEIYAKAPAQRATIIHTLDGDSTTVFNGREGWIAAPHKPVPVITVSGGELDGIRLDAELSFPARIKDTLRDWRVGPQADIDDLTVEVL